MNKQQRKLFLISLTLFILMIVAGIGIRYFPLNKLIKLPGSGQIGLMNKNETGFTVPHTLLFDFEVDSASANPEKLYKGIAHSGRFSAKAFGSNSYTVPLERKAGDIGLENLSAIAMSAWIYVFPGNNDPVANLVFAASNNKINIAWKGIRVEGSEVPRGKWFKISGQFDISDIKFKPDTKLEFYFWNNSRTDILADDIYVVFGGPKPRKGDSARVDLTNGRTFTPSFNFPPFPFYYLEKDNINNENSSFLIKKGELQEGDISPYDRLLTGYFISGTSGTEDLLVISRSGEVRLFTFCVDRKEFKKVNLNIGNDLLTWFRSAGIFKGSFTNDGSDQILLAGDQGVLLGEFGKVSNTCQGKSLETIFKPVLSTRTNPFKTGQDHLFVSDLDGNKHPEILAVSPDGSWKVFRIQNGKNDPFQVLASGAGSPNSQWNSDKMDYMITAGHFLVKYNQDILLTVGKEKGKSAGSFSLFRFDLVKKIFISCFPEKQNNLGKTTGLDTLSPWDEYLTGTFDNTGRTRVFRYNHEWRYDLKEIQFNDSSFRVIANMDFHGYDQDHNPKYFEILRLLPGKLVKPGMTSFLVIGKNCKEHDQNSKECIRFEDQQELPNTIQVYSPGKTEK